MVVRLRVILYVRNCTFCPCARALCAHVFVLTLHVVMCHYLYLFYSQLLLCYVYHSLFSVIPTGNSVELWRERRK